MCPGADASGDRARPWNGRGTAPRLHARMESLLPAGANTGCLANAGRVDTPPPEGHPTQAMATRKDDLSGTDGAGGQTRCRGSGGGKRPPLVAQQWNAPQLRSHDPMGRPVGIAQTRMTSISRIARCRPARRVAWQGSDRYGRPLCRFHGTSTEKTRSRCRMPKSRVTHDLRLGPRREIMPRRPSIGVQLPTPSPEISPWHGTGRGPCQNCGQRA